MYQNKIDVIYIDPPYNTENANDDGNNLSDDNVKSQKFIYRDKFSRTGWLNMMRERLYQSKSLLSDDGVIFVSIDDNEQAYLKVLMDEIFGEDNFASTIILDKRNAQNDAKNFEKNHEYILCYQISNNFLINKKFEVNKNKGKTYSLTIGASGGGLLINRKKLGWTLYYNEVTGEKIPMIDYDYEKVKENSNYDIYSSDISLINKKFIPIRPPYKNGSLQRWTWGIEKAIANCNKIIPKQQKNQNWILHYEDEKELKKIPHKSIIIAPKGSIEIKNLGLKFNYPKSIDMIIKLIDKHSNKNAIVLDFFAGSGTTGHAVMDLNQEDGGNRKFILVTNNENDIAKKITWERLNRLITKNNLPLDYKGNTYQNESVRVFEIDQYQCGLKDDIEKLEILAKKSFLEIDKNYDKKLKIDVLYDLKSLHPLKEG